MGYLLYIVYMRDVEACSLPCNTQCFADFDLHRPQQVSSQLLEQLGEEDVEPVVDQWLVVADEVREDLEEHAENLLQETSKDQHQCSSGQQRRWVLIAGMFPQSNTHTNIVASGFTGKFSAEFVIH